MNETAILNDFPVTAAPPPLSKLLHARGIALRGAGRGDLPFLRALFAGFRAPELAMMPWAPAQKQAFTEDQFRLQHNHFTHFSKRADFWIIDQTQPPGGTHAIGRLYVDRSTPVWRIVDIGLVPEARGNGIGQALIEWVQESARVEPAKGVGLQVSLHNRRARELYMRLGFADDGGAVQQHQPMLWRVKR